MSDATLTQPVLTTARLRLRPLLRADAALIELYASDPRVARMTTRIPHPYPPGTAEAFVARALAPGGNETVWAMDTGADGENGIVGIIALECREPGAAEIGYWVAPAFWNTGYASEAVAAIAAHAAAAGLGELRAQVLQDNLASAKVLSRDGFLYVGDGETYSVARGAVVPTFLYRLPLGPAV
jgi:RimJ/RimL family protein N-acetyltransferase